MISETILVGFLFLEKQLANLPDRGFLFLRNSLLLYSLSPYSQTESQTETQIHSLCMGWRNLFSFPVVLLCQFFVLAGNRLWFYILLMYFGVPQSCGVVLVFFVLARNSFWCFVHILYLLYSGLTQNRDTVAQVPKKTFVECTKYVRRHTPAKAFLFWREIVFGVSYIWYLLHSGLHPKQGYRSPGTKKNIFRMYQVRT